MYDGLTREVTEIGSIDLMEKTGHLIPNPWLHHLRVARTAKTPRKGQEACATYSQPDFPAILLLAEVVWRYRPVQAHAGPGRAFKMDKWQTSYRQLEERFGMSENIIRQALYRLRDDYGAITIEYRDVSSAWGRLHNCMFIAPVPSRIREITEEMPSVTAQTGVPWRTGLAQFNSTGE